MLTVYDQIQELRAELASCALTRSERIAAETELETLRAEQARLDRSFDAELEAWTRSAPPG